MTQSLKGFFSYPPLYAGLGLWVAAVALSLSPWTQHETKFLNPPPEHIEHFSFGFSESMADALWLRWIQDADFCQTYLRPKETLAPAPAVPLTDLKGIPRHQICDTSWSFKMLDAVTKLAPRFEIAYLNGASMLAIVVEDYEGTTVLYERGLAQYPKNWQLLYRAAFHYQYDINDLPKAADLLNRSVDNGAPVWVKSLAARLYTESGQLELALRALENFREAAKDNPVALERVDKRIAELKAKLSRP